MNRPSFASVYRTAAILAAFSQASASDEALPQDHPFARSQAKLSPTQWSVLGLADWLTASALSIVIPFGRMGPPRKPANPQGRGQWRWQPRYVPPIDPGASEQLPRPLVLSHFAFCDELQQNEITCDPLTK